MNLIEKLFAVAVLSATGLANAASPGDAPQLPITGTRIVNVSTEAQLQSAMGNLQNGDTILLSNGTYNLTSSLYINGRHNVTIRGTSGSTNVVLAGKGMDNSSYGNVPFGIWSNGTNSTIAHLTIRDTWDNEIIFNPGAQSPRVYCVRLINAGSQFIKSNPTDVNAGISAHAAQNWIIRGNLFKNLHNPDGTAYPWNPSVLFWRQSVNTLTEQNVFLNVDRAVAYGLDNTTPYFDHAGGVVRNNYVYLAPGLMSANRKAGSDGSIIAWNSPGTQIDHNTVLLNSNEFYAVEFRFPTTTNATARNNLADAPVHLRDSATATQSGNLLTAVPGMFVNPSTGDLHLLASATNAIDKAATLGTVTNDFDGDLRPKGASSDVGADEFTTNAPPRITNLRLSGTNCLISFTTFLGVGYDVQRASEVTGSAWSLVVTNLPGTGGVVHSTDTNATGQLRRFYLVRL